ncbi:MAG: hypothetical protein FWD67_12300 [Betaproteobacteria bacterium]|nr:hypothetical protein [Betaproteobacteria bacterium]
MDSLRTIPTGFENAQNIQNARAVQNVATPRERDSTQPLGSGHSGGAMTSVQVDLSDTARAAARSEVLPSPPSLASSASAPTAPVQMQDAVVRARSVGDSIRVERQDAAASTAPNREAVQRYMENANNKLPAGQSAPSSVRVSA